MAKPNAASRTPAAGTGSVSIPRLFIDQHLRDVHGAALNVYLALCGQQARAGRNKEFRYTIPEIGQAAGLKKRIISKAIESLVERRLIERQRRPGPVGNLYRIIWGRPAATNGEPIPASGETDVPRWNPTEPEQAAVVATRPAGEQEDGGAGRGENKKQEAQITKDTTHPAPRQAEAHPPTLSEPESSSLPQESILTTMPPTEPLEPAGGEQKAIPSPSTPAKTPPAAANTAQPHPASSIPPSSSDALSAEIHRLAYCIIGRPADLTLIRDLRKAADKDLELLRTVLEEIDKRPAGRPGARGNELEKWRAALAGNKKPPYDAAFRAMFCEEVYRRCQNLRSELKRPAAQPPQQFRSAPSRRERRRMAALADNQKRPIAPPPTPKTLAPR